VSSATDTYVLLRAFVDELVRCGMRAACTSPGSRCAPLVLTLAREERLCCYSHVDERCAGFFALGLAKSSGLPVAVACTSGTAAAELLPAAIEAHEARVPLLLLTADRPPELRENGAGQAIDQLKLFGSAAKWFFEVGVHEASEERLRWMRTLACRAYWTALEGRPGAVHLNFPLREPLVSDEELPPDATGRHEGRPYVGRLPVSAAREDAAKASVETWGRGGLGASGDMLKEIVAKAVRGVVVAGRYERDTALGRSAAAFCEAAGWPLLADPLSGARRGEAAIAHYDALLRDARFASAQRPDLVLRVGDLPVSKPLRTWLAGLDGVLQVGLDPEGAWQDPASVLTYSLALEPATMLAELAKARVRPSSSRISTEQDWLAGWRVADERAAEAILGVLGGGDDLSEPAVAAELGVLLPEEATLFVASSMPVRDVETFWPVRSDPPRVLCNRGANGIDGTVSSAFGVAADGRGPVRDARLVENDDPESDSSPARGAHPAGGVNPVVLLIGDVALAYDLGGLLAAKRLDLKVTIVLLDNGGGGIFDFLPVSRTPMARAEDIYTCHIATPTELDFAQAAALYGLVHERVETVPAFRAALERALSPRVESSIVEVRTDRAANVELHGRIWSAVSRAGSGHAS
jgi:2-succinyl-5-enolpyruvyl-6-hydroxy-3-cyclohexene-1-carboxylate synthase